MICTKQLTNFSTEKVNGQVVSAWTEEGNYLVKTFNPPLIKLGYVCEVKGIGNNYPIYIKIGDKDYEEFIIGKTGMFEIQPEVFTDINEGTEPEELTPSITGIKVPKNIVFKLDYSYMSN